MLLYQPSAIEIKETKGRDSQSSSNLTLVEASQAMSAGGNEVLPNLAALLRLPREIRNIIYYFILPTDTCLRFYDTSTPNLDRTSPRLRFHPEGPSVPLRYCKYNQRSNTPSGRTLRACVWWQASYPVEKGIFFTSRALQREALEFLFQENTLAVSQHVLSRGLEDWSHLLGPWIAAVRSVIVMQSIAGTERPISQSQQENIVEFVRTFSEKHINVCIDICAVSTPYPWYFEEHLLSIFRQWGQCGAEVVELSFTRCSYHPLTQRPGERSVSLDMSALERKCAQEFERSRREGRALI